MDSKKKFREIKSLEELSDVRYIRVRDLKIEIEGIDETLYLHRNKDKTVLAIYSGDEASAQTFDTLLDAKVYITAMKLRTPSNNQYMTGHEHKKVSRTRRFMITVRDIAIAGIVAGAVYLILGEIFPDVFGW